MSPAVVPAWFWYLSAGVLGAVIGSFLNVVIHRLPREESIVFPASRCPGCSAPIRPWDNVPIVSYLFLRGRCRSCGMPISPRYPLVEGATAFLFVLAVWHLGFGWRLLPQFIFTAGLVAVLMIDLEHTIIPDELSLGLLPVGLLCTWALPHTLLEGMVGVAAGCAFFYLVRAYGTVLMGQEAMGEGDTKLGAMMGAFLGWQMLAVAVFLALMLGSAVGLALVVTRRRGRRDEIPFGPFLAVGALIASLWGRPLLDWYLSLRF